MNETLINHRNAAAKSDKSHQTVATNGPRTSRATGQMISKSTWPARQTETTILVVDDEESLRNLLVASLQRAGYNVVAAGTGRTALERFAQHSVDLVLLDVLLPDMDGFAVCQTLREQTDVPIVMLTALSRPDDLVRGFEMGADDYIAKPFTFREVEARLQAILRRVAWTEEQPTLTVLAFGDVILNDDEQRVLVGGQEIELTPIEYQLLYELMCSPDQPISKDDLFKAVWGYDETGGTNLVEVAVRRLREKIESRPSKPQYLRTVRGAGYKFDAQFARSRSNYAQSFSALYGMDMQVALAA